MTAMEASPSPSLPLTPPPPPPLPPPPPPPEFLNSAVTGGSEVSCAGCRMIVTVGPGLTKFECPTCQLTQRMTSDLTSPPSQVPPAPEPLHGVDRSMIQLLCVNCKVIVNVPHGLSVFPCPNCKTELPVDGSRTMQPPLPPEEVNEVAIEVEREEDGGGVEGETFTDYRPPKMSIGPPHPDPIVETSSLSAVQPPEPTYDLKTKHHLEISKTLSCLQIETLVYACQRHLHHLDNGTRAGFFLGDGAGVGKGRTVAGLIWENWQHGRRKALWISVGSDLKFDARRDLDDVGATCIQVHALNKLPYSKLDSKSVGITEGVIFLTYSCLIASSGRARSRLQQLVQWFGSEYDGLIVFDECHKAKNLIPEAGAKPTQTGEKVLELQARLPEARVVYCSATGASEPRNLGYMVRLGLWGAGTSFGDFHEFFVALVKGGVGALELVAMDMKARGMYVCRTLSYKGSEFEVIEVPLEDKMTEIYTKAAEFWAELRVELLSASELIGSAKPKQLWMQYWGSHQRFFRYICMSAKVPAVVSISKQALVDNKCVVIGLQTTGEARTEDAITKYGTELDDFISGPRELLLKFVEDNYPLPDKPELPPEEDSVKELKRKRHSANPDVSSKGRGGKSAKGKPASDDESGHESEWEPPSDDESGEESESDTGDEYVEESGDESAPADHLQARRMFATELLKRYEAAVDRRSRLLDTIRAFDLPNNPLDELTDQLGGPDNVAEITGRRGMLVRAPSGKGVNYQERNTKDASMEMVNMHEKQLFMDGKKLVAIISEAGSAGVSLQADRRALNQKRRVHVTLELPWSADRAIQQFGRTHRSNQVSAPQYRLLFTNLGGERRFASVVAKRLASLGALTQGDRRAGPSLSAYNYDSFYGKKALSIMYKGIMEKDSFPVLPPNCSSENPDTIQDFIEKAKAALASIGIIRGYDKDSGKLCGHIVDSDMNDVARFLNRLLGLPPEIQNRLFELFASILDHLIYNARVEGRLDTCIVDLKANTIELKGTPKTVHTDHMSGASTALYTFVMDRGITWETASALLDENQKDTGSSKNGFYESKREWLGRRHFLLAIESSYGTFKIFRPATGETAREMSITELKDKYRKMMSLERAHRGWKNDYEVSSKQCMHGPNCKHKRFCTVGKRIQEVNLLGGLILPIWGTIQKALSKQVRLGHRRVRVVGIETTTDNQRVVGLFVPNAVVESVLQDLACPQDMVI